MKLQPQLIAELTRGQIFSLGYVTKDGNVRTMAARMGVHSATTTPNTKRQETLKERNLSVLYKMSGVGSGFRTIGLDKVTKFAYRGFVLEDNELRDLHTITDTQIENLNNLLQ